MQSPSPAAVASTPPNAPTPSAMAVSPQAPKSPKSKPTPKPKNATTAKQRRQSKVSAQSPAATGSASAPTPQSQASPEALSTPVQANASIKRPREEESSGQAGPSPGSGDLNGVANGPSPPKRAKVEPSDTEHVLSETSLASKPDMSSQISHIKTDEDASQFFMNRMQELIDNTANSEGQESLANDLTETLQMLFKGYGPSEGEPSGSGFGSDGSNLREPSPPPAASLFDEFFDFSTVADEEDTKVDTPELVSSSSTNPSPESNTSESDVGGHHVPGVPTSVKTEPKLDDISDAVRLGTWKEIDGGEAAYYQSNEWKWEGQMNAFDHPWAIFNQ